jgi:hypothetical protein
VASSSRSCGTFVGVHPYKALGSVHLSIGEILGKTDSGPAGLGESTSWRHVIDSRYPACWYRFTGNGQVEILALGARVVVPVDSISLLPEPVARAVLSELAERVAGELRAAVNPAATEEQLRGAESSPSIAPSLIDETKVP